MRKVFLLSALLISVSIVFAKPVTKDFASKIAYNYYKHFETSTAAKGIAISSDFEIKSGNLTTMYVFNFNPGGFVIVAADDASVPVLAESGTGVIQENNMNPELSLWLEGYSKGIVYIVNNNLSNKQTIKEWNDIANNIFAPSAKDVKEVTTPLITAHWDQNGAYNDSCPNGNTLVGCVAVATAQVMKYHNYPAHGLGSHSYTDPTYGLRYANFAAATYNWAGMTLSSANAQVAKILYHVGVSVDMQYSTSASSSYSYRVPNALINYFDYQNTAEIKYKSDYTDVQWKEMIKNDLNNNRPLYYSGNNSGSTSGHAFNCDGWRTSDGKFHFNWGWSGSSDGWYTIGTLNPGGQDFSYFNAIVIRVQPKSNAPKANFNASNYFPAPSAAVNFTDISQNSPTGWTWVFEDGTPATSNTQSPTGVTFATVGKKLVTLLVSNGTGTDVTYKIINVGGTAGAWIKQNTAFTTVSRGIQDISIIDQQTVWATAYDGVTGTNACFDYTRTLDGGNTWTPGTITGMPTGFDLAMIWGMSGTDAYACINPGSATGGKILHTTNGGANWAEQTTAPFTGSWANWVAFFNQNEGVCMGDPASGKFVIYTTTDGGTNWVLNTNAPTSVSGTEYGTEGYFDVVGSSTIYFGTTAGRVIKSTDKGLNWSVCAATGLAASLTDVAFKDANTGFAFNYYSAGPPVVPYKIVKTTDGGASWAVINPTGYFVKWYIDHVPGTGSRWMNVGVNRTASGQTMGSSYSYDDCATFLNIDTGSVQYTHVTFFDENTGWAGGFNASASDGGIWKWDPSFIYQVKELGKKNEVVANVYPNPSYGVYNIALLGAIKDRALVEVYDMVGRIVLVNNIDLTLGNIFPIDISNQKTGLYFIRIFTDNQVITEKVSLIK